MEFFSKTTSSNIVSKQVGNAVKRLEDYDTAKSEKYAMGAAANLVLRPGKFTSRTKRDMEKECAKLYGDSLLACVWENRTLVCYVYQGLDGDAQGNDIPPRVTLCYYLFNARSLQWDSSVFAIVTNHALQRIIQRKANFDVLNSLKQEIDLLYLYKLFEALRTVNRDGIPENREFKFETRTGIACAVFDDQNIPVFTTWYPK